MKKILSRYTYEVDRGFGDQGTEVSLIYNSFADGLAQIPTSLFTALEQHDEPTLKQYKRELRALASEGFLIDRDTDELRELRDWYNAYIKNKDCLEVTILLSYRCNFSCSYCFETKVLGNTRMPAEIQHGIVEWIKTELAKEKIPSLHVTFFGGEPLVEKQLLFELARELRQHCLDNNVHFDFGLITNGFHLSKELYEQLTELGLVHVKVTLDGDKEVHDRQRPLKGGRGSFETILKNLKHIGVLTSFTLGGNFDSNKPESTDSIVSLLDRLQQEGLAQTVGRFGFKPIQDAKLESTSTMISSMADKEMDGFLRLEGELKKRNLPRTRRIDIGPCDALKEHSIAIDPKGDIYPCGAFAGDKRACIGNVVTGPNENYAKIMGYTAFDNPRCNGCKHLPGCFGGCRWVSLMQKNNYSAENCMQPFFEQTAAKLLKMEADFHTNPQPTRKEIAHENHPQGNTPQVDIGS